MRQRRIGSRLLLRQAHLQERRANAKSAAGVGRSVARGGKGTKFCEACQEYKPETDFALNQVVDMQCKKYPAVDISSVKCTEPIATRQAELLYTMSEIK